MSNPQEIKQAILATLAEKGDYATILKHLDTNEKKEKGDRLYKLIEPISAFADLLTQNNEGAFMEKLTTRMDGATKEALEKLGDEISKLREELQSTTSDLLNTTKADLVNENLSRYQQAETTLSEKMMQLAVEVTAARANEILPSLAESARLTEDEINEIIDFAALSVESQISSIVGEYIDEHKLSIDQIVGFAEAVKKLLPKERQINWNEIIGRPDLSQGGTNTNIVRRLIAEALADFSGGSGIVETIVAGTGISVDDTDPANPIVSVVGSGSGIVRNITVTSGNVTAGASADTDYVYKVVGAHTVTLPTAVGNTNQYDIINLHSADVSLATTSSQTIHGTTAPVTLIPNQALTLQSDGANWMIK